MNEAISSRLLVRDRSGLLGEDNMPTRTKEAIDSGRAQVEAAAAEMVAKAKEEIRAEMGLGLKAEAEKGNVSRPKFSVGDGGERHRILNRQIASWAGAPGKKADGIFPDLGSFLRAISPAALKLGGISNDYSSLDPSAGGFLVPEVYRGELLAIALD